VVASSCFRDQRSVSVSLCAQGSFIFGEGYNGGSRRCNGVLDHRRHQGFVGDCFALSRELSLQFA